MLRKEYPAATEFLDCVVFQRRLISFHENHQLKNKVVQRVFQLLLGKALQKRDSVGVVALCLKSTPLYDLLCLIPHRINKKTIVWIHMSKG